MSLQYACHRLGLTQLSVVTRNGAATRLIKAGLGYETMGDELPREWYGD